MKMIKKANDIIETAIRINTAVEVSCMVCNILEKDFRSRSRLRHIIDARRIVYSHCRETLRMSWLEIAKQFKINHATAIHHCKIHKQLTSCDTFYFSKYNTFQKLMNEEITLVDIDNLIQMAKKLKENEKDFSQEK